MLQVPPPAPFDEVVAPAMSDSLSSTPDCGLGALPAAIGAISGGGLGVGREMARRLGGVAGAGLGVGLTVGGAGGGGGIGGGGGRGTIATIIGGGSWTTGGVACIERAPQRARP